MADNLTPAESATLMVLMAEAREISNPELNERYRITLTGKSRQKLNNLGYVKTWKVGQAFVHVLDDKGWDRVHQGLNFDSPRARALGAALSALHDNLRERVLEHGAYRRFGEMFAHTAEAPVDDLETRIRTAYGSLAPRPGAWLRHTDVRRKLADVPSEALDQAFLALSRAEDVDMMGEANQKILTAEDRRNAVRVGGQDTHLIAIGI
ncbi:hypothetical protein GCM10027176_37510 [Actinoallomurus bryophytorum]|uniref:Uncharacterized protein n=1 Tax=Actinoallomurus bryophytorum TaxID=1490222 RepID=A0A543CIZ1_9ACTN|nr:hypothetical protein [Actinoallomurus bryophytorum]TQL97072.1 hypothetical protein FB559_2646 [Actinoallomurus bryophytorum]